MLVLLCKSVIPFRGRRRYMYGYLQRKPSTICSVRTRSYSITNAEYISIPIYKANTINYIKLKKN